jgi:hypothetical protein
LGISIAANALGSNPSEVGAAPTSLATHNNLSLKPPYFSPYLMGKKKIGRFLIPYTNAKLNEYNPSYEENKMANNKSIQILRGSR